MAVFNEKVRINDTSALLIPVGTSGQQPTPSAGFIRFNSSTASYEGGNGTSWQAIGGQYTTSVNLVGATVVFTPSVSTITYELFGIITVGSNTQTIKLIAGVSNSVWDYTIYSINSQDLLYTPSINTTTGVLSITATGNIKYKYTEI